MFHLGQMETILENGGVMLQIQKHLIDLLML